MEPKPKNLFVSRKNVRVNLSLDLIQSKSTWNRSFGIKQSEVIQYVLTKKRRGRPPKSNIPSHCLQPSPNKRQSVKFSLRRKFFKKNQVEKTTSSAKSIIAQIRNSISFFDAELVKLLYVSQVRPHLEFAVFRLESIS